MVAQLKQSRPADLAANRVPKPYRQSLQLLPRTTKVLKPQHELEWKVNMHDINKLIYNHKHIGKYLSCPTKITVESGDGLKVVLQLRIHPFGVEEDENKNVTFEVVIDQPKKRRLHSEARLLVQVSAECEKQILCSPRKERKDANLSYFYIKGFISHEQLKNSVRYSRKDINVIVMLKAEIIIPTSCKC